MTEFEMEASGALTRIAEALEELLALQRGEPREMSQMAPAFRETGIRVSVTATTQPSDIGPMLDADDDAAYAKAVQDLVDMPNDIPPEPAENTPKTRKTDVVAALNKYAAVHGIAAGKAVLAQFAPKLDDVDPKRYGELVRMLAVTI